MFVSFSCVSVVLKKFLINFILLNERPADGVATDKEYNFVWAVQIFFQVKILQFAGTTMRA